MRELSLVERGRAPVALEIELREARRARLRRYAAAALDAERAFTRARLALEADDLHRLRSDKAARAFRRGVAEALKRRSEERLPVTGPVRVRAIQAAVAARYEGMGVSDILGSRRTVRVVMARHVAIYLSRALTAHSLPVIGREFGGKDHSTIFHALRRIEGLMASDPALAALVASVKAEVIEAARSDQPLSLNGIE